MNKMIADYRFAPGENTYEPGSIKKDKDVLSSFFPNRKNDYEYLNNNEDMYKACFSKIFYSRCAYCGRHIDIIGIEQFQIDHMIPKNKDGIKNNDIDNLAFCCPACNTEKRQSIITDENISKFQIEELGKHIIRDPSNFVLSLSKKDSKDQDYRLFFDKLYLASQKRRLDYALHYCDYFLSNCNPSDKQKEALQKLVTFLRRARNIFTSNKF